MRNIPASQQDILEFAWTAEGYIKQKLQLLSLDEILMDKAEVPQTVQKVLQTIRSALMHGIRQNVDNSTTVTTELTPEWVIKMNKEKHLAQHEGTNLRQIALTQKNNEELLQQYLGEEHILPEYWFVLDDRSSECLCRLSKNVFEENQNDSPEPLELASKVYIGKQLSGLKDDNPELFRSLSIIQEGLVDLFEEKELYADLTLSRNITVLHDRALIYDTDTLIFDEESRAKEEYADLKLNIQNIRETDPRRRQSIFKFYRFLEIDHLLPDDFSAREKHTSNCWW